MVTNSMCPTSEKLKWIEGAGLKTALFDHVVNSCEIQALKPDPAVYSEALRRLLVSETEAVFLGHDRDELEGARHLGITTVVMEPTFALEREDYRKFDYIVSDWSEVAELPVYN
ncbi:bifunctional epoxide hydrolase 2-like [Schistocerca gregaria]|uniref:bifunctional epoxide hydrolase 2-like n=1 Tax=Schistocerca gregaria TaxID=7010 RepID=UPI00211E54AA|nr:bifunctional epoxide hydrolase 2-like [Schistocerca gregaria]